MRPSPPVRLDAEVIELLRDSPELLAIADAITATQAAPATRRRATRLAAVAAVLGLAVALALVSPWSGRGSLVDRALAAIGSGAVIHVVEKRDLSDQTLVDLRTGAESPVAQTRELWFDGDRGLLRSVQRVGGAVTGEVLETPKGSWTESGRVYTCAWIAAHPVEATKARVSCNPSGQNGTMPRRVPEPRPDLDPALAGFVTGYREALANGTATRDGAGVVAGRAVEWLRFAIPATGNQGAARVERVAVDAEHLDRRSGSRLWRTASSSTGRRSRSPRRSTARACRSPGHASSRPDRSLSSTVSSASPTSLSTRPARHSAGGLSAVPRSRASRAGRSR